MRLEKAWIVAAKEMAEFRSNKYVVITLLLLPLGIAVIMPLVMIVPIASQAPSAEPLVLDPPVDATIRGEVVTDRILVNYSIEDSTVRDSVIRDSRISNSTLVGVTVQGSILRGVTLKDSVVRHSNVHEPGEMQGVSLIDSPVLGVPDEFTTVLLVILNSFQLFFVIIPAAIPALLASYSFVGEKLNKSLEPLLATPTTDGELLMGKSLSIFLPTMGATWLSAAIFMVMANMILEPVLGFAPLPTLSWIVAIALIAPLVCTLSITANVMISSRVSDVRASQQLSALVILPVLFLFMLPLFGVLELGGIAILLFAGGLLGVNLFLAYVALKLFRREKILVAWK